MGYVAYIGVNFDQFEKGVTTPNAWLRLDTQEPKQIDASSEICKFPLQNGDTMSDHMYRNPTQETISGYFSINGKNWNDDSYNIIDKYESNLNKDNQKVAGDDRLSKVEQTFEKIKNEGYLCTIVTVDEDTINTDEQGNSSGSIRFKIRRNMALQSISWTEGQNNVKYSFRFSEVIMVEQTKYDTLSEEEIKDLHLPNPSEPMPATLTSFLLDTGGFQNMVVAALGKNQYLEDDWTAAVITAGVTASPAALAIYGLAKEGLIGGALVVSAVAGVAVGVAAGKIATLVGASVSTGPVGWVAGIAVFMAVGIAAFISACKKRARAQKAFKLIHGQYEPKLKELDNLLDDIQVRVNKVSADIDILQLNNQTNGECIVTLDIGGNYYYLNFNRNNVDDAKWTATVQDGNDKTITSARLPIVTDINQFDRNTNLWFRDSATKEYEVYIVNPYINLQNKNDKEKKDVKSNLNNYFLFISRGKIKNQIQKIYDAINKAISEEGFN